MARERVSPGRLYAILNAEWSAARPEGCTRCMMPLPVALRRPDAVSANWRVGASSWCPFGCHLVIADIAARLWPDYDLTET